MAPPMAGTLDRKAMIMDSSSESSGEHRPPAHAYDGFSVSSTLTFLMLWNIKKNHNTLTNQFPEPEINYLSDKFEKENVKVEHNFNSRNKWISSVITECRVKD